MILIIQILTVNCTYHPVRRMFEHFRDLRVGLSTVLIGLYVP